MLETALFPSCSSPPNKPAIAEWVSRHREIHPKLGELAQVFSDNINHISFDVFMGQLKETIKDFHAKTQDKPYVLCIPVQSNLELLEGCSDLWVAGLALQQAGLRQPQNIVYGAEKLIIYLQKNPLIKNILVLDDCVYSGTHIGHFFDKLYRPDKPPSFKENNFYIGIPFQTNEVPQCNDEDDVQIINLQHKPIKTLREILNNESEDLREFCEALNLRLSQTLTYFDHAMPDSMSTHQVLSNSYSSGHDLVDPADTDKLLWLMGYVDSEHLFLRNTLGKYRNDITVISREQMKDFCGELNKKGERLVPEITRPYRKPKDTNIIKFNSKHAAKYGNGLCCGFFRSVEKILGISTAVQTLETVKTKTL